MSTTRRDHVTAWRHRRRGQAEVKRNNTIPDTSLNYRISLSGDTAAADVTSYDVIIACIYIIYIVNYLTDLRTAVCKLAPADQTLCSASVDETTKYDQHQSSYLYSLSLDCYSLVSRSYRAACLWRKQARLIAFTGTKAKPSISRCDCDCDCDGELLTCCSVRLHGTSATSQSQSHI